MKLKVSLFLLLGVAAGCVDIPDFSDTPVIYYYGVSQRTEFDTISQGEIEIATVTIDFEDGDGDLGASAAEVQDRENFTKQYMNAPGWNLEANYELVTMIKRKNGSWSETIMPGDSFKFFQRLKLDGKSGPIKGTLDMNARFLKSRSTVPTWVKFKVRIMDRAFHFSDQITTDSLLLPILQ